MLSVADIISTESGEEDRTGDGVWFCDLLVSDDVANIDKRPTPFELIFATENARRITVGNTTVVGLELYGW